MHDDIVQIEDESQFTKRTLELENGINLVERVESSRVALLESRTSGSDKYRVVPYRHDPCSSPFRKKFTPQGFPSKKVSTPDILGVMWNSPDY